MRLAEPLLLALAPVALLVAWYALKRRDASRLLAASRALLILLLVVAAANPVQVQEAESVTEIPRVTLVQDDTVSMDMFRDLNLSLPELENRTEVSRVRLTGNSSPIGDVIRRESRAAGALLFVSDGRVTEGAALRDAVLTAAQRNTTVFFLRPPERQRDLSVEVLGPKNVIEGENTFTVRVRATGDASYTIDLRVDGSSILNRDVDQTDPVRSFNVTADLPEGSHRIEADITVQGGDHFEDNNHFIKTVWAAPEPRILLVNGGSSLSSVARSEYRVDAAATIPDDLSDYRTVVLNDLRRIEIGEDDVDVLTRYVVNGGGLVVVGGRNSYNFGDYRNSSLTGLLPVRSEPSRFFGGINLVLVIDISESTREGAFGAGIEGTTILDQEKANAVNVIRNLESGDRVSAVGFGGTGFTILPSAGGWVEQRDAELLVEEIRRLTPQSGGGTLLFEGLSEAETKLGTVSGTKSVVVMSDGGIKDVEQASQQIELLRDQGAEVLFVKVRSGVTGNDALNDLAAQADVPLYEVEAGEVASLDLGEQQPQDDFEKDRYSLTTSRTQHFVTRGLSLGSTVTGFNDVTPKPASDLLVVTDTGRPVLTTWTFGLGRVAALSTDDGSAWASRLYAQDGELVTRTVNWAVEDPRSRDSILVTAPDGWVGSPLTVRLEGAETPPDLSLGDTEIRLSRSGTGFTGTVTPSREGTYTLIDYPVAVNYPREQRVTGFNQELYGLLPVTGGTVFEGEPGDIDTEELLTEITVRSQQEVSLRPYVLIAALLLLIGEISYRRWREIRG